MAHWTYLSVLAACLVGTAPLEIWVQAAKQNLRIKEIGVPRVYLDPSRAFGGVLTDPSERLAYYRRVIDTAEHAWDEAHACAGAACP